MLGDFRSCLCWEKSGNTEDIFNSDAQLPATSHAIVRLWVDGLMLGWLTSQLGGFVRNVVSLFMV